MAQMTDELNRLVAAFIKARDADGTYAGRDEAYALAEFCADVFEKPFVVRSDDGERFNRVPHKSSQDVYRETWRKEGRDVSTLTLRHVIFAADTTWYSAHNKPLSLPDDQRARELMDPRSIRQQDKDNG